MNTSTKLSASQKGIASIYLLIGLLVIAVLLIPIPYYQDEVACKPCASEAATCPPCPKAGWYLGDPLWKKIFNYFYDINTQPEQGGKLITVTPSPSSTPEETTNWKTFTTKTYTFLYPPNWEQLFDGSEATFIPTNIKDSTTPGAEPDFSIQIKNLGTVEPKENIASAAIGNAPPLSKENIKIDGHAAIKQVVYQDKELKSMVFIYDTPEFSIKENRYISNGVVEVLAVNMIDKTEDRYSEIFDQILSTFKFLP